jgi:radical SAM protein with 4Fe4S-binding SPASM domain
LAITPDGYLTTCYEVVNSDDPASELFFVGRVSADDRNGCSVSIDHEKMQAIAARTVDKMSGCSHCFSKYWCAGDCPVKAYRDTGSIYEVKSERCNFIRQANESIINMILNETYLPVQDMSIVEYSGGREDAQQ